jgi:ABC-type lipoprotein release transport system permease subunit
MVRFFLRLLSKRALIPFLICVLTVSAVTSTTGLLLMGALSTVPYSLGNRNDVIALYSNSSQLPQTSLILIQLATNLSSAPGVQIISPEALATVAINGQIIYLRGMNMSLLRELDGSTLVAGAWPNDQLSISAMAGQRLANRLHLTVGENLTIQSSFGNFSSTLTLSGVFSTNDALNDELITGLPIGQMMRGSGDSYVSIIRMKVDPSLFHFSSVQNLLGGSQTNSTSTKSNALQNLPITSITNIGQYLVGDPLGAMGQILSRSIGLSETSLWALFLVVFTASILSLYYSLSWGVKENAGLFSVLSALGMTRRGQVGLFSAFSATLAFVFGILGYSLANTMLLVFTNTGNLQVLFHTIVVTFNPWVLLFSVALIVSTVLVSNWKIKFGETHDET